MKEEIRRKIEEIYLEQALRHGGVECPECGEFIEPDAGRCSCGWKNPLIVGGFI